MLLFFKCIYFSPSLVIALFLETISFSPCSSISSCLKFYINILFPNRESTPAEKIREAHRRVMVANHPDAGGSHYLASKINEAKDMMLGKAKGGSSAF